MIEWILSSSVLILTVLALRWILSGRISLRLRYALWIPVLVRLLMPLDFFSSTISVQNLTANQPVIQAAEEAAQVKLPKQTYMQAREELVLEYEAQGIDAGVLARSDPESFSHQVTRKMESDIALADIGVTVWLAGAVLMLMFMLVCNLRFRLRLRRDRRPVDVPHTSLPVYVSVNARTPCLVGVFRPVIYLTEDAAQPDAIGHVLEHELTHYRHWDNVFAYLRCLALALHWYNPLVWWAADASRQDAELACDEATIIRLGEEERIRYGQTLIRLTCCQKEAKNVMLTATTMTGSKKSLRERVRLIARKPKMAVYTLIAVVLIVGIAVGCTFTGAQDPTEPATEPSATEPTASSTEATQPEYDHNVIPIHSVSAENTVWDFAEGYFAECLKQQEYREVYSSVTANVPGEVFLDPLILRDVFPESVPDLYLIVADGVFSRADGDASRNLTERIYYLMAWTGGSFQCISRLSADDIKARWEDPQYADCGDPYTAAAIAEWEAYQKGLDEYWAAVYDTDYYMAMQQNGQPFKDLGHLLKNRLRHAEYPSRYGNFRLTDLRSGRTYRLMPTHLFDFDNTDGLSLDWENAVADGSGLHKDATIMVQIESLDGSWYAQIYDGSDANWVYLSECELYVPVCCPDYDGAAQKIRERMGTDYEQFLWIGLYIDHYGSGSAEEAVRLYLDGVADSKTRTSEECRTGRYAYGDVDIENVNWEYAGDQIELTYTIRFLPKDDGELKVMLVDPEATTLDQKVTLIREDDGYWRDSDISYNYTPTVITAG